MFEMHVQMIKYQQDLWNTRQERGSMLNHPFLVLSGLELAELLFFSKFRKNIFCELLDKIFRG